MEYAPTSAAKIGRLVGVFNPPRPYFRPTGPAVVPAFLATMIPHLAHKMGSYVWGWKQAPQ